ncbi:hypothetical protein GLX27_001982 [Malassezia furfur]|uniref:Dolichyl-diphosphooligosaccharide--protein glycosyltransferase subunit 2 n=1 Tax=Malassezia furfur TaxID=55194 RepID=A0ABY8EPA4_MALFU|nr:hypothetical protein CBS14141_003550 [Malassezia furfur]WFD47331.1 hypothetical protein GLX27_001982 [Malassezia furfur]
MRVVRALQGLVAVVSACAALVQGASYDIKDARLSVQSFDGSPRVSERYASKDAVLAKQLVAEPDDVIRFSFTIADGAGNQVTGNSLPQQVWVVLADATQESAARSFVWPLRVRESNAGASFNLRMDKLSPEVRQMLAEQGPDKVYALTLLVGSFAPSAAERLDALMLPFLKLEFGTKLLARLATTLVSARELAETEDGFRPMRDHFHTFAVEPWQTMPPKIVSLAVAFAIIAGPWLLLVSLWKPTASTRKPTYEEAKLGASLVVFELQALWYWIGMPFYVLVPLTLFNAYCLLTSARAMLARTFVS